MLENRNSVETKHEAKRTIHIADWNTGEDYRTFATESEALEWIGLNCVDENGAYYYMGNRVEMY